MDDSMRSSMISQLICRLARHLANVAPAASFWSSGIAVVRSRAGDGIALTACLLVLFISAGVSAIVYHPAFRSVKFGLLSLALAVVCMAKELLICPSSLPPLERLKSSIWEYGAILWFIAVGVMLAPHLSPEKDVNKLLPPAEQSRSSFSKQSFLASESERDFQDGDDSFEALSTSGSFYFKCMLGPSSHVSSQTSCSESGISLASNASCVDASRTARVKQVVRQTVLLSMTPARPEDSSEDVDQMEPTMDG